MGHRVPVAEIGALDLATSTRAVSRGAGWSAVLACTSAGVRRSSRLLWTFTLEVP